ncbi:unnamed protein product [marine sediment metagenome]|uniref:Uncharacterized protein n=1 Tax=marine sediment metagenome TaxID=412755 RepID=X1A480_9ZZZZ
MKTSEKLGIVGAVMLVVGIGAALIFGDTWHGEPFANIWGILYQEIGLTAIYG